MIRKHSSSSLEKYQTLFRSKTFFCLPDIALISMNHIINATSLTLVPEKGLVQYEMTEEHKIYRKEIKLSIDKDL